MNLKQFAPLLLSLIAVPAFAHGNHDDDEDAPVPTTQEAKRDTAASNPKPEVVPARKPAAKAVVPAPAKPKKP
jgi:hypothetical protein